MRRLFCKDDCGQDGNRVTLWLSSRPWPKSDFPITLCLLLITVYIFCEYNQENPELLYLSINTPHKYCIIVYIRKIKGGIHFRVKFGFSSRIYHYLKSQKQRFDVLSEAWRPGQANVDSLGGRLAPQLLPLHSNMIIE